MIPHYSVFSYVRTPDTLHRTDSRVRAAYRHQRPRALSVPLTPDQECIFLNGWSINSPSRIVYNDISQFLYLNDRYSLSRRLVWPSPGELIHGVGTSWMALDESFMPVDGTDTTAANQQGSADPSANYHNDNQNHQVSATAPSQYLAVTNNHRSDEEDEGSSSSSLEPFPELDGTNDTPPPRARSGHHRSHQGHQEPFDPSPQSTIPTTGVGLYYSTHPEQGAHRNSQAPGNFGFSTVTQAGEPYRHSNNTDQSGLVNEQKDPEETESIDPNEDLGTCPSTGSEEEGPSASRQEPSESKGKDEGKGKGKQAPTLKNLTISTNKQNSEVRVYPPPHDNPSQSKYVPDNRQYPPLPPDNQISAVVAIPSYYRHNPERRQEWLSGRMEGLKLPMENEEDGGGSDGEMESNPQGFAPKFNRGGGNVVPGVSKTVEEEDEDEADTITTRQRAAAQGHIDTATDTAGPSQPSASSRGRSTRRMPSQIRIPSPRLTRPLSPIRLAPPTAVEQARTRIGQQNDEHAKRAAGYIEDQEVEGAAGHPPGEGRHENDHDEQRLGFMFPMLQRASGQGHGRPSSNKRRRLRRRRSSTETVHAGVNHRMEEEVREGYQNSRAGANISGSQAEDSHADTEASSSDSYSGPHNPNDIYSRSSRRDGNTTQQPTRTFGLNDRLFQPLSRFTGNYGLTGPGGPRIQIPQGVPQERVEWGMHKGEDWWNEQDNHVDFGNEPSFPVSAMRSTLDREWIEERRRAWEESRR